MASNPGDGAQKKDQDHAEHHEQDHHHDHDHAHHTAAHDEHSVHSGHSGHSVHDEHSSHAGHADHSGHEEIFRRRFWVSLLLTIPVLIYSPMLQMWFNFTPPSFPGSAWIEPFLATVIFIYGGMPFLQMAEPEVRQRKPGMMVLISLAITVAFAYSVLALWIAPDQGFFWEMALLIDVMLLGHWLEMRSVRQASGALDQLAKLMPDMAERVTADGGSEQIPVDQLEVGDLVLVRPGGVVPADGEVVEGNADANEAMLTGESMPVAKKAGDTLIAGAIISGGSLRVRVDAIGANTALAGIMRLVEEAQSSKSPTQMLADRAAGWLFYIALAFAAATAIGWTIAEGWQLDTLKRVATVLVIACPHALGLAIPLVVAISTTKGAQNGILVRNRNALEDARLLDTIIFDKTGTLTTGEQALAAMATSGEIDESSALALAASVEQDSEHMVGQAIRLAAVEKGVTLPLASQFVAQRGKGVSATVDGRTYHVGGPHLLEELGASPPAALNDFVAENEAEGKSIVYLLDESDPVASFAVADTLRPESQPAVRELQEMGIEVQILTGDSNAVATSVANQLGITRFYAGILPERKDDAVIALQKQGHKVGMVGDGVNDAPALTRADVGIAIGGGTDVAIDAADIILVQSNPQDVPKVIRLSKATHRKMVENLWWATGYNVIALPLAAGVLAPWGITLSPAVGAVLMSISTIVVALNAQLLRRETL